MADGQRVFLVAGGAAALCLAYSAGCCRQRVSGESDVDDARAQPPKATSQWTSLQSVPAPQPMAEQTAVSIARTSDRTSVDTRSPSIKWITVAAAEQSEERLSGTLEPPARSVACAPEVHTDPMLVQNGTETQAVHTGHRQSPDPTSQLVVKKTVLEFAPVPAPQPLVAMQSAPAGSEDEKVRAEDLLSGTQAPPIVSAGGAPELREDPSLAQNETISQGANSRQQQSHDECATDSTLELVVDKTFLTLVPPPLPLTAARSAPAQIQSAATPIPSAPARIASVPAGLTEDKQLDLADVLEFSRSKGKCLSVQLEMKNASKQRLNDIAAQFKGHVRGLVECKNGNYVVAKLIEVGDKPIYQMVIGELLGSASMVAQSKFGCRVFQRLVENCSTFDLRPLINELLLVDHMDVFLVHESNLTLCKGQFSNYLIQKLLEDGSSEHKHFIGCIVAMYMNQLCLDNHGATVVRKAFENCAEEDRGVLNFNLHSLLSFGTVEWNWTDADWWLDSMVKHRHAHETLETILQLALPDESNLRERLAQPRYVRMLADTKRRKGEKENEKRGGKHASAP